MRWYCWKYSTCWVFSSQVPQLTGLWVGRTKGLYPGNFSSMAECGKNFHWKWTTPHRIGLLNTWTRTFSLTHLAQVHRVRLWSCFSPFLQFGLSTQQYFPVGFPVGFLSYLFRHLFHIYFPPACVSLPPSHLGQPFNSSLFAGIILGIFSGILSGTFSGDVFWVPSETGSVCPKSSIDCAVTLTGLEIDIFWCLGMLFRLFRKLFPRSF